MEAGSAEDGGLTNEDETIQNLLGLDRSIKRHLDTSWIKTKEVHIKMKILEFLGWASGKGILASSALVSTFVGFGLVDQGGRAKT